MPPEGGVSKDRLLLMPLALRVGLWVYLNIYGVLRVLFLSLPTAISLQLRNRGQETLGKQERERERKRRLQRFTLQATNRELSFRWRWIAFMRMS